MKVTVKVKMTQWITSYGYKAGADPGFPLGGGVDSPGIYIVKFWTRAPRGPNSFNFMQFLGKFGEIVCWRPPGELVPPPQGNPGSATEHTPNFLKTA